MEHILFEQVSSIELFQLKAFENLGGTSFNDYLLITQAIEHVSSIDISDTANSLDILKKLENGELPTVIENFLKVNNVTSLHCDKSLKKALANLGIMHKYSPNIFRGIRLNIDKLTKRQKNNQIILSVAHSYSKDKIRYDVQREDNIVINIGYELDALEADIELITIKIIKFVTWNFPELQKFFLENTDILEKIVSNDFEDLSSISDIDQELLQSIKSTVENIDKDSLVIIKSSLAVLNNKKSLFKDFSIYLGKKMQVLAPNLRQILGDRLCVKFIHKAGGLMNLALCTTSTLQLIGAEKALFQSLKRRSRTPKYGLLYEMDILKGNKGRMARFIASKCSLAARIDVFSVERTDTYGKELIKLINKKLNSQKNELKIQTSANLFEKL